MSDAPGVLIRLTDAVRYQCGAHKSRFRLEGLSADALHERATVAFPVAVPADLPDRMNDVSVERLGDTQIAITASGRSWLLSTHNCFVHREVAESFYRAITPRAVPLSKRLFWRVVLLLAGNPVGRRLLLLLRR